MSGKSMTTKNGNRLYEAQYGDRKVLVTIPEDGQEDE